MEDKKCEQVEDKWISITSVFEVNGDFVVADNPQGAIRIYMTKYPTQRIDTIKRLFSSSNNNYALIDKPINK